MIVSVCDLCVCEESVAGKGALPKPSTPTAPVKISSSSAAKNSMKSSGFWPKNPPQNAPIFHESLPVVVLGASPLKIGAFFSVKNPANFSGRAPNVKVVLRESGHVDCVLSETACPWSSPSQRIISESAEG